MKKNIFKSAFAVAAIATVGLGSYKAYGSYTAANMSEDDLLWAENIEALARDEGKNKDKDKDKKGCSNKSEYVMGQPCPQHNHNIGFCGTRFSCSSNGTDSICKSGDYGMDHPCYATGNPPVQVNTVTEKSCK